MRSALIATFYDHFLLRAEHRFLGGWRDETLAHACGCCVEIGAGTGLNLPRYPAAVQHLIVSEPDAAMRRELGKKIHGAPLSPRLVDWPAERLVLPDASVDTVVSTLVLCSVTDLRRSLEEIHRVLRPGGQLLFIEHITAAEEQTCRWQRRLEPLWCLCSGGCRLTRATDQAMLAAGFAIDWKTEEKMPGVPAILARSIRGRATKQPLTSAPPYTPVPKQIRPARRQA
ncbi:MAG: class I SAM-dependent methyltransferase [Pelovirga sp.]